jgi:hypothetical protein
LDGFLTYITEEEPESSIQRLEANTTTSTSNFLRIISTDRISPFTQRVLYNCPRCRRDVWSWKLVEGITCLSCMGFSDVQTWGEGFTYRIAMDATDTTSWSEMVQLLTNFFQKFGFARGMQFILFYALHFYRVAMRWSSSDNAIGVRFDNANRSADDSDLNEPLL